MSINRAYRSSNAEYTVSYPAPRGVDFSSESSASTRSRAPLIINLYRDHAASACPLESIPGFRKIISADAPINGIFLQNTSSGGEHIIVHAGTSLYRFKLSERDSLTSMRKIATLENTKSCAYSSGSSLYVLDGKKMCAVNFAGNAWDVIDTSSMPPYIPTTYRNGVSLEQRNLLTERVKEELFVALPDDVAYASDGIEYTISDADAKKCAVTGIRDGFSGELFIPSYIEIGNERYEVTEIYDYAFADNTGITKFRASEGIKRIGKYAFTNCTALEYATLPDSVSEIDTGAFSGCEGLYACRLGRDISRIGENAFSGCEGIHHIEYALNKELLLRVSGHDAVSQYSIIYNSQMKVIRARIRLYGALSSVESVRIGTRALSFTEERRDGRLVGVILTDPPREWLTGATVTVNARAASDAALYEGFEETGFITKLKSGESPKEAILACRVCECFDGRIFLSGNPDHPNTVFYSARDLTGENNPLYFGVYNYFSDGVGSFPVISMLSAGDSLAVFKAGDDGTGSIFYHTPRETDINLIPKIYPVSYVHSGICALGPSVSFFDDPLFLSPLGLMSLEKKRINLERSTVCRSHNVNARLLSEDLSRAALAKWCGYLFITAGGRAYLADSRALFTHASGNTEYEWFYLEGIGTYRNDSPVYRYSETAREPYSVHERAGEAADGVMSIITESGETVYYTEEMGVRYELYKTEERSGGEFSPATELLSCGNDLLIFGTSSGDICIFNNDKRGTAPDEIKEAEGFEPDAYAALWGERLHPSFYSFASHTPRYLLKTVWDDGDVPYLTKSSVRDSLILKLESLSGGRIECEVKSDTGAVYHEDAELPIGTFDFASLDFSSLEFRTEPRVSVPIGEKLKGWVEKEIRIGSEKYNSPFGIWSLSYRYRLKGKIKKKKH